MKKIGPWTSRSSEVKYENPWIQVDEHQVINPGGGDGIYGKVHFKNRAIGIIPIDDEGNTWLVGQHRFTLDQFSWEIPEGGCPHDEEILTSAQRELQEETGLEAEHWELILEIHTSNSVSDEVGYIFIAKGLTEGKATPEESESDIQVKKTPLTHAIQMVMDGEITDSLTIAGLLKAKILLDID